MALDTQLTQIQSVGISSNTVLTGVTTVTTLNATNAVVSGILTASLVGNVTGNVTGNLTGAVTGNITGNVTGNLSPSSGVTISSPATNTLAFITNNAEVGRFDSSGNFGVGNASPAQKLDVSGNIRATGSVYVSAGNTTGGGIVLADDGDIVDLNDGYASIRFSNGVRIYNTRGGGIGIATIAISGYISARNTAKCFGSWYSNVLGNTMNVSSFSDQGGNVRRVNFTTAFNTNGYAVSGYTSQGDSGNDNVPGIVNKNTGYFEMVSNNQTGGTSLEAFSNAGWVVFADNGGTF